MQPLKGAGFENLFVGGDCQTGPKTAILAIGAGKVAARNIDDFLRVAISPDNLQQSGITHLLPELGEKGDV